jgi:hypothetical protein
MIGTGAFDERFRSMETALAWVALKLLTSLFGIFLEKLLYLR